MKPMRKRRAQRALYDRQRDEAILCLGMSAILLLGILWPV